MNQYLVAEIANLGVDELVSGIQIVDGDRRCVACGETYRAGYVYPIGDQFASAEVAAAEHVESAHGGMLRVLTGLPREISGLTEIQSALIAFLGEGLSDKAIARRMDDKAVSTIRNHRFQLRRRVTEAKLLAALGELLDRTPASRNLPMPTPDDRATRTETRKGGNPQM